MDASDSDSMKPVALEVGGMAAAESESADSPEIAALVAQAKAGDVDAFAGLMRLYDRRIVALARHMGLSREDAMDACQDTFLKVFKYLHRFETGRTFFKWLYRIAIHVIYDHLRRARAAATVALDQVDPRDLAHSAQVAPSPHPGIESKQLTDRIQASLGGLSRQERIVFVLRDLQEMRTEDIGVVLGLSQVTVRRHCMSARRKLRERLFLRPG